MKLVAIDDVWMRIECEEHIARELSDYFTFDVPGAQYMQQFRKRNWNGKIRLFKLRGNLLYRGLADRVHAFAAQRGYKVADELGTPVPVLDGELDDFITALELPVAPRDYQVAAVRKLLDDHRGIILSPTGSGKSLIVHILIQALQVPTLIVVPTISLVAQMESDLVSYGCDPETIQTIQAGRSKSQRASIIISTWQSIYEQPASYFDHFSCIIVDEVHLAKAKSLVGIMEKCRNTPYRFGCTGTLDDTQVHRLILEGLFGTVTRVTTTHALVQNEQLTPLLVKLCAIKYPLDVCKELRRVPYRDEIDYLLASEARLTIVANMAARAKGNTLVLFNYVEKHGMPLFERIQDIAVGRTVHFVYGGVEGDDRERIRKLVEQGERHIIVASYGTFSTGVNIPNLQTLIFASPSKSKFRVLQSIGRTLRLHKSKDHATLIDFIDDLRVGSVVNYAYRHAEQRVEYYASERHAYELLEYDLETWVQLLTKKGS